MSYFSAVLVFCLVALAAGEEECLKEDSLKTSNSVCLSDCEEYPCKLKKKSTTNIELKFTPQHDVAKLTNSVSADILGIPFPFVGVDGASVCSKIFDASTGAKVSCPLKKGKEYIYKDGFKILDAYPKIKVTVHWSLKDEKGNSVLCFQVPAKITS